MTGFYRIMEKSLTVTGQKDLNTYIGPHKLLYMHPKFYKSFFLHVFLYFCSFKINYLIYPSGWVGVTLT